MRWGMRRRSFLGTAAMFLQGRSYPDKFCPNTGNRADSVVRYPVEQPVYPTMRKKGQASMKEENNGL